jgi:hypothetical protein
MKNAGEDGGDACPSRPLATSVTAKLGPAASIEALTQPIPMYASTNTLFNNGGAVGRSASSLSGSCYQLDDQTHL